MRDQVESQKKLKALNATYVAQLPEKLEQLDQALGQLSHTVWDEQSAQTILRLVHSLAGSGDHLWVCIPQRCGTQP